MKKSFAFFWVAIVVAMCGTQAFSQSASQNLGIQVTGSSGGTNMAAPSGYTAGNLYAEDNFSTTSLDTTKWVAYEGASSYGRNSNNGGIPSPYSAQNQGADFDEYFDPYPYGYGVQAVAGQTPTQRVTTGCGTEAQCLLMTGQPSTHFSPYHWSTGQISGWTTSTGAPLMRMTGCTTSCYLQVRAQMPDCRYGAWASIWGWGDGPSGNGVGSTDEFDLQECGFAATGSATANQVLNTTCRWSSCGNLGNNFNTGVDLSAAYHIYGLEYVPGVRTTAFFDGTLVHQWAANCTGLTNCTTVSPVPTHDYSVIIDFEFACGTGEPNCSSPAGFRTIPDGTHNGPFYYYVNDVQLYRK
jgi:hypothetical protein